MISILLTVLKIIGIAILVILGLILFILLLVLFVPVRYNGKGSYCDGSFAVGLRASWLLHMISASGTVQNGQSFHICIKLLGITIYDNLKETKHKIKNKKIKSTKNKTENTGEIQAASSESAPTEDVVSEETVRETNPDEASHEDSFLEKKIAADDSTQDELTSTDSKILRIVQKIKIFFIKFVNFFKNIKFTFDRVCDTIVKIKNNIKYYLNVLKLDSTKRAFVTCQKQLRRVLRKISPQKYQVKLHLGFDDPAVMGEILAVWGMFYPIHQGNIDIAPEFEQSVIEGDFFFRGHVSVFVFVQAACILFFDKDIKRFIKQLKYNDK